MLDETMRTIVNNKHIKESIPTITLVILIWLIATLFTIMQDYKNTIMGLQNTLTTLRLEMKTTQQNIKEVQLLCIDTEQYIRQGNNQ